MVHSAGSRRLFLPPAIYNIPVRLINLHRDSSGLGTSPKQTKDIVLICDVFGCMDVDPESATLVLVKEFD